VQPGQSKDPADAARESDALYQLIHSESQVISRLEGSLFPDCDGVAGFEK
jgi:hypothetical protein